MKKEIKMVLQKLMEEAKDGYHQIPGFFLCEVVAVPSLQVFKARLDGL